jgi:hypothetical protein
MTLHYNLLDLIEHDFFWFTRQQLQQLRFNLRIKISVLTTVR